MTSPDQSQKAAGLGVPSANHPGSRQSRSGPPLPCKGMLQARGTPALPSHPPTARDGHTNNAKRARGEKLAQKQRLSSRGKGAGLVQSQVKYRESSPCHFSCLFVPCVSPCTEDVATKFAFSSFNDAQRGSALPIHVTLYGTPMTSLGDRDHWRHRCNHPRWDFNHHPLSHEVRTIYALNPLQTTSHGVQLWDLKAAVRR